MIVVCGFSVVVRRVCAETSHQKVRESASGSSMKDKSGAICRFGATFWRTSPRLTQTPFIFVLEQLKFDIGPDMGPFGLSHLNLVPAASQ